MDASHRWSAGDIGVLARAVVLAPSVHNIQPWRLELPDGEALLIERTDLALPYHDPLGRDRAISCGAAVANLEVGMRVLARPPSVRLLPEQARPELVARLVAGTGRAPGDTDLHRYSAIARRHSYRHTFAQFPVSDYAIKDLIAASSGDGVHGRVLRGCADATALADVLEYAAAAVQQDLGYQRELAIWTIRDEDTHRHGTGIAGSALPTSTVPWAGLVRPATALPDRETLAARLERETVLVFVSPGDGKLDHLRTGIAMQRTWLAAVDLGLKAAVQTQPLHLAEARARLVDKLGLTGYPQLLMRVGHPAGSVPRSPHRRAAEVIARDDQ
jgi:nitroreductase